MATENDLSSLIRDALDCDNEYNVTFIPSDTSEIPVCNSDLIVKEYEFITPLQVETHNVIGPLSEITSEIPAENSDVVGEVLEFITPLQVETHNVIEPSKEITHKDLYEILASWDLGYLYDKCISKRVFYKNLPHLTQRHVDIMFEKNEVGDQASFEYFLFKWQNNCNANKESSSNYQYDEAENSKAAEDDLENLSEKPGPSSSTEIMNAKSILMRTEIGRSIIQEYKIAKKLNDQSRSRICQLISDYYVTERDIKPGVAICRKITQQVLAIFPSELYETYLLHRGVQTPQGKLYDKMLNTRKRQTRFLNNNKVQKSTECLQPQKYATYNESFIISTDQNITGTNDMQTLMSELKHLRSPWKDVITKWQQTSYYRVKQLMNNDDCTMENLLENWPLYEHAQAPELITIDFYQCFKTTHTIYTNWEIFTRNIPDVYKNYIRDATQKLMLNKLISDRNNMSLDAYNLELLFTLPQILPTNVKKNQKGTKLDAQSSFIMKAVDSNDLQKKLDELKMVCLKEKLRLQPLIAAIGNNSDFTEFYVIFDSIKYKFGSFLEAVNICYFIFHLFNLKYPEQCINTWFFIQKFFYSMNNAADPKVAKVMTIINEINN